MLEGNTGYDISSVFLNETWINILNTNSKKDRSQCLSQAVSLY